MPNKPPIQGNRILDLARAHPAGLTVLQFAAGIGSCERSTRKVVTRLFERHYLERTGERGNFGAWLYVRVERAAPPAAPARTAPAPEPVTPAAPEPRLTSAARSALRVVRGLERPSAAALAGQYGCTYPEARRIWAELADAGVLDLQAAG